MTLNYNQNYYSKVPLKKHKDQNPFDKIHLF